MYISSVDFIFQREDTPDYFVRYHDHQCYELVYYIDGSGYCFLDGEKINYSNNQFVIIPPGCAHNDVHLTNCKIVCIGFTLIQTKKLNKGIYLDKDEKILKYLNMILDEFMSRYIDYINVVNNLIDNLIIEINRSQEVYIKKNTHDELIKQIINYVDAYFATDIKFDELTDTFNYSYDRFRHIFKDITGITIKQYVINKRLEYAKQLLKSTNLSILEIATKSGFSSSSYFVKEFKSNIKKTPSKYRREFIENNNIIE